MTIAKDRILLLVLTLLISWPSAAQTKDGNVVGPIRASAAYAEVLLRKTELEADIESYLADYTEENPKIVDARHEIGILIRDIDKIYAVRPSEVGKLTSALGKLIVRRAALETDLLRLLRSYNADHPEVKRAKKRIQIFDRSIREILG